MHKKIILISLLLFIPFLLISKEKTEEPKKTQPFTRAFDISIGGHLNFFYPIGFICFRRIDDEKNIDSFFREIRIRQFGIGTGLGFSYNYFLKKRLSIGFGIQAGYAFIPLFEDSIVSFSNTIYSRIVLRIKRGNPEKK